MAIWQYHIYFLPEEEINSYFPDGTNISEDAFNEKGWWRYRQIDSESFAIIGDLLPLKKSWSDHILQFGDLESNCFEVLTEFGKVVEVSARIDLRLNNKYMQVGLYPNGELKFELNRHQWMHRNG